MATQRADDWTPRRIRQERTKADMTQRGLGELLGISGTAVSRWENGETSPNYDHRQALTRIFIRGERLPNDDVRAQVMQLTSEVRELRQAVTVLQELVARLAVG